MKYSIQEMAAMSGVSARTLRYYEEIGLLCPNRNAENDYRVYNNKDVDQLQQILIYRSFGISLKKIKSFLYESEKDTVALLKSQMDLLEKKKVEIDQLIWNVKMTILEKEGQIEMNDSDKFIGLKKSIMLENETKYGKEVRERYDQQAVEDSKKQFMSMSREEFDRTDTLSQEILDLLRIVLQNKDFEGDDAHHLVEKHREWIEMYWGKNRYTKDAHRSLADMYVQDERFRAYYDNAVGEGAAETLRIAIYQDTKS